MRHCAEHERCISQRRVVSCDEREVFSADTHSLSTLRVCGSEQQLQLRVPANEQAQLASGIAAGSKDSDRKFMHS